MTAPAAPGALAALVLLAAGSGCAYFRLGGEGPGHVNLERPPAALAARGPTLPQPPRDPALVVSPGVLVGTGMRPKPSGLTAEAGLGFEIGAHLATVTMGEVAAAGERAEYGLDGPAWGLNLGWTPTRLRTGSLKHRQPDMYLEAQWRVEGPGLAAGLAFSPTGVSRASTGVQLVPQFGPVYARGQLLLDGHMAIEVGLACKLPVVFSKSRYARRE